MTYQQTSRGFVIRIESGEPIIHTLLHFFDEQEIRGGLFVGIGAVSEATVGMYHTDILEYRFTTFDTPLEITNLTGNVSVHNENLVVHAHVTLADERQNAFGGHLEEAVALPTCEVFFEDTGRELNRTVDDESLLALFDLEREEHEEEPI